MSGPGSGQEAYAVEVRMGWTDAFEEQFGSVPWWLVSTTLHALVLGILSLIVISKPERNVEHYVKTDFVAAPPPVEPPCPLVDPDPYAKTDSLSKVFREEEAPELPPEEVDVQDADIEDTKVTRDKGRIDDGEIMDMHDVASVACIGLGAGAEGSRGKGGFSFRSRGPKGPGAGGGPGPTAQDIDAVARALRWLARHQEPDGHWDASKFGGQNTDVGVTGLALLAFLGAGHDEFRRSEYRDTVKRGVTWLISKQASDGAVGRGYAGGLGYHHSIAGLALAEAFGMGGRDRTSVAAQKAVTYSIETHVCPGSGWRYRAGEDADTSVTGWFVMQLKSAIIAGLDVDVKAFQYAAAFLDTCTDHSGHYPGRTSYQPGRSPSPAMTAVGLVSRIFIGWRRSDRLITGAVHHILQNPARWEDQGSGVDFYYWYYAMLGLFQVGGQEWKAWGRPACELLVEKQRRGGPEIDGSWDPAGRWCDRGGRVYSTAMGALSLEVFYRYPQVFGVARRSDVRR